jgi:hypothetical protein
MDGDMASAGSGWLNRDLTLAVGLLKEYQSETLKMTITVLMLSLGCAKFGNFRSP